MKLKNRFNLIRLLKTSILINVKNFIKIALVLFLGFAVTQMPFYSSGSMKAETEKMELDSCCAKKEVADKSCQSQSDDNENCAGQCTSNCCCLKLVLKNEKPPAFKFKSLNINTEVVDIYNSMYKYIFNHKPYKPPIHSIS